MANTNLNQAKCAKNDEFYTQYADIEKEIFAYLDYDPNVLRDKTILLPCDDPEWSNFTRFFVANFRRLGLKKLISTSFAVDSKTYKGKYQPSLFEMNDAKFDPQKTTRKGKVFILDGDKTGDCKINIDDLDWQYLNGNGDFRSAEVTALRDEADIIITNPPFSLFREFLAWIMEANKQFLIIGNMNALTYKEVFPLIKENKIWLGVSSGTKIFIKPDKTEQKMGNTCWYTNLEHGRRHQPLSLMTMTDNLRYSRHKEIREQGYQRYDNYDAIDVPFTDAIPSDYDGVMGVPVSFLDRYCPEQFEIVGITKTWFGGVTKIYPKQIQVSPNGQKNNVTKLNDGVAIKIAVPPRGQTYYMVGNEYYIQLYARILIRHRRDTQNNYNATN